jgi:hypothetical protein
VAVRTLRSGVHGDIRLKEVSEKFSGLVLMTEAVFGLHDGIIDCSVNSVPKGVALPPARF